ncbi:MAG TPA: hypothetical protein VGA70_12310 [Longimicrobiales bacterium]
MRRTTLVGIAAMSIVAGLPGGTEAQGLFRPQGSSRGPDPSGFYLSGGLAMGATRGWIPGFEDWTFGPVAGARLTKQWRMVGVGLMVDQQLYWAEQPTDAGDFRTTYVFPTLVTGRPGSQFRLAAGGIRYEFEEDETRWEFAFGVGITRAIKGPFFAEFGWRRHTTRDAAMRSDLFFLGGFALVRL